MRLSFGSFAVSYAAHALGIPTDVALFATAVVLAIVWNKWTWKVKYEPVGAW